MDILEATQVEVLRELSSSTFPHDPYRCRKFLFISWIERLLLVQLEDGVPLPHLLFVPVCRVAD